MSSTALRNLGIIAHIDAGKTTLTERILRRTGEIRYCGEVHEGTTVTDWLPQEREHGISILSASVVCQWRDVRINVVDTPGHVDFTAEVERVLRVLDGAVAVFCGIRGVQAQSETVWRQANRHRIPMLAFVNKLDREGASYERVIRQIAQRFHVSAVAMQVPLTDENGFVGMVDILTGRCVGEGSPDIDFRCDERVKSARTHLVECLAETDDEVMTDYLSDRETDEATLRRALRKAVLNRSLLPVFGGSAAKDVGVDALLDAVRDYLPSPTESIRKKLDGIGMLVFKVYPPEVFGEMLFCVRLYGGHVENGTRLLNPRNGATCEVGTIYRMRASQLDPIEGAENGDIVALTGLGAGVVTGDTLCDLSCTAVLERMTFPEPVVSITMEGRGGTDSETLGKALKAFCLEDPTLRTTYGPAPGQWTLAGMGELHLAIVQERLKGDFGIDVTAGKPQVSYRKTVQGAGHGRCEFEKRLPDGRTMGAMVEVEVEALPRGGGLVMDLEAACAAVEPIYGEAAKAGLQEIVRSGVGDGNPLTDMKIKVIALAPAEGGTSELAFQTAAHKALSEAVETGGPLVLEPIMKLEVTSPQAQIGNVIADLTSRRGRVTEVDSQDMGIARVVALVPLGELFGYASSLRSLSGGRGDFVAEPSVYAPL